MNPDGDALARTPEPPYWAVVFTSVRAGGDDQAYAQAAERMAALASGQPGYLGLESARGHDGVGVSVSYWSSLEALQAWRDHVEHQVVQRFGRERWYSRYSLRIARVERARAFERPGPQ